MSAAKQRIPLPANYRGATPEQVAKSMMRYRPEAPEDSTGMNVMPSRAQTRDRLRAS